MIKFLLEATSSASTETSAAVEGGIQKYFGAIILLIALALFFFWSSSARKKQNEQLQKMIDALKVGDKVVTQSNIYGEIVEIKETEFGKVAILKTGDDEHCGYLSVSLTSIWGVENKTDELLDEDGNKIDIEKAKEEVLAEQATNEDLHDDKKDSLEDVAPVEPEPTTKRKRTKKTTNNQ